MKVYQDVFTSEEIISDSFQLTLLFSEAVGEVNSKWTVKGDVNVDIGCGNAFGGTNEEEGAAEGGAGESMENKVIDIIDAFKYNETSYTKGDYQTYMKAYLKKVKTYLDSKNKDRIPEFQKGATEFFKWVLSKFDEFTFYTPESYDTENSLILSYYKEGATAPTFLYLMDGLKDIEF